MTSIEKFCFLNLILLSSTPAIAEVELSVSPTSSGRLYADYSFGDCCTLDAWSSNSSSSTLWTETCEIMGGYCMGGKDVANWVFEMPDMPVGSTVLDARLELNKQSGAAGSAMIYLRQTNSSALGTASALQTYNAPMHTQNAYFSNAMSHSFGLPTSFFEDSDQSFVAVALFRSSMLHIHNAGTLIPALVVTYEGGVPPCPGDVDLSGVVDFDDILMILAAYGSEGDSLPEDTNTDGIVDLSDLLGTLATWGTCPE